MPSHKRSRSSLTSTTSSSASSEENSSLQEKPSKKTKRPKALKKVCSDEDLDDIRIYLLTRKVDDTSDDSDEKNWKRADYRVLKNIPNHDDEDDEVEPESEPEVVERSIACCISEFNSGLSDDTGGEEQVRIGFLLENKSSIDVAYVIGFNGLEAASKILKSERTTLIGDYRNNTKGFSQDFIVSKSKMAQDESEVVDRALLDKLGVIEVKIHRAQKSHQGKSHGDNSKIKSTESPQIKIKESMIKTSAAMSLNFGAVKQIPSQKAGGLTTYFDYKELLINLEIKYRNYIGYLVELAKANVPIEQKKTTTESEKNEEEIIEIESDEDDEIQETTAPPPIQTTPALVLTPFKSQSLMSKVKENVSQLEAMSTEDLIKFIKLIDEKLYESVKDPFRNENIDGSVFLALSGQELKELGIKIGEQIKIKQIIQQVREN
ncbi:predicted protein [Naegleria gruberi]|uniref:Predicted protein n=1 Tax=Naegleria gruberi TaxID=5762 RepID=D2VQ39_NAEGR|nr:uncharacterized protein NAEGRDRAFT_51411 [Naegleria gruberi]EFC41037.1 predicted protein [Naegleria gruberi]|eukprot:XP_002673781.1 predicted protein [Naegleria gruberi strain NEG-M]